MLPSKYYREIKDNPAWVEYLGVAQKFHYYLETTDETKFRISGVANIEGELNTITREIDYIHRWTPVYKRSVLARFYRLENWHNAHPLSKAVTMLTLTTYHAFDKYGRPSSVGSDVNIEASFKLLKAGWYKLRDAISKLGLQYVWILEPHKTGYPHLHVAIFGWVPWHVQHKMKVLWQKYGCGSYEHGAQFSTREGAGGIKSIRNYLMKYMIKSWHDTEWTTAQFVFNALCHEYRWRMWGATKHITMIIRRESPEKSGIEWQLVEMKLGRFGDFRDSWRRPVCFGDADDCWQNRSNIVPVLADWLAVRGL